MIYPLAGILIGAALGAYRARRRKGNRLDMAQWAAVHGMIFGLLGLLLLIFLARSAG